MLINKLTIHQKLFNEKFLLSRKLIFDRISIDATLVFSINKYLERSRKLSEEFEAPGKIKIFHDSWNITCSITQKKNRANIFFDHCLLIHLIDDVQTSDFSPKSLPVKSWNR